MKALRRPIERVAAGLEHQQIHVGLIQAIERWPDPVAPSRPEKGFASGLWVAQGLHKDLGGGGIYARVIQQFLHSTDEGERIADSGSSVVEAEAIPVVLRVEQGSDPAVPAGDSEFPARGILDFPQRCLLGTTGYRGPSGKPSAPQLLLRFS